MPPPAVAVNDLTTSRPAAALLPRRRPTACILLIADGPPCGLPMMTDVDKVEGLSRAHLEHRRGTGFDTATEKEMWRLPIMTTCGRTSIIRSYSQVLLLPARIIGVS